MDLWLGGMDGWDGWMDAEVANSSEKIGAGVMRWRDSYAYVANSIGLEGA